jgi:hypothetical protein
VVFTNGGDAAQAVQKAHRNFSSRPSWKKLTRQLRDYCFKRVGQSATASHPGLSVMYKHPYFKRDSPELHQFVRWGKPPPTSSAPNAPNAHPDDGDDDDDDDDDDGDDGDEDDDENTQTGQPLPTFVRALLECANDPAVDSVNWDNEGTHVVFTNGRNAAQAVRKAYHGSFPSIARPSWTQLGCQLRAYCFQRVGQTTTAPRRARPVKFKHSCFKRDSPELYQFVRYGKPPPNAPALGASVAPLGDNYDDDDNDGDDTSDDDGEMSQTTPSRSQLHVPKTSTQPPPSLPIFVRALLECVNDSAVDSINWNHDGTRVVFTNREDAAQAMQSARRGFFRSKDAQPAFAWKNITGQLWHYRFERIGQTNTPHPDMPAEFQHPYFKRDSPGLYRFVLHRKAPPTAPTPSALNKCLVDPF